MNNHFQQKLRAFLHSFIAILKITLEIIKLILDIMNSK